MFVDNLPEVTSIDWLRAEFSSLGKVWDAFILASSRKGRGKCFGFASLGIEGL